MLVYMFMFNSYYLGQANQKNEWFLYFLILKFL